MGSELTPDQRALQHRLKDMPANVRPHVRVGFENLSTLSPNKRIELYKSVIENFNSRARLSITEISEIADCERRLCADMMSAVMVTISSVIDLDVQQEDFLKFLPEDSFAPESSVIIEELLQSVFEYKERLKSELDLSRTANAVLPSFTHADMAVDVRIKFGSDNKIEAKVPVLIAYIDTDSDGPGQWLQFSAKELDSFIEQLKKMQIRLQSVAEHV